MPHRIRTRGLVTAIDWMLFKPDPVTTYLLEVDGVRGRKSRARRLALRADLLSALVPRLAHMLSPRYDPARDEVPPFVGRWMRAFEHGEPLPVLGERGGCAAR